MRGLCLPGQARLHFTKERPRRRGEIAAAICRTGAVLHVYGASVITDPKKAREACLGQLVADLASAGAQRLVIEQDESLLKYDQTVLYGQFAERASPARSRTSICPPAASRCCGSPTPRPGAGRTGRPGKPGSRPSWATCSGSQQREARLTHRPEGCRAHFGALLHPALTTIRPLLSGARHWGGRAPAGARPRTWRAHRRSPRTAPGADRAGRATVPALVPAAEPPTARSGPARTATPCRSVSLGLGRSANSGRSLSLRGQR